MPIPEKKATAINFSSKTNLQPCEAEFYHHAHLTEVFFRPSKVTIKINICSGKVQAPVTPSNSQTPQNGRSRR
ncbi:MAG: hypothetical protein A3F11_03785 [Gammaproteobacteria bacterium RIFCSPHIGHO2_12_FULL_37_14]|nr:MAG: hypothetical protein A3F11_03785 [Gammaproteobacteria bacterium RIFCSPHIGHO2_12_FULL_37_14]